MALFGGKKKADLSDPRDVWEEFFKAAMKNDWDASLSMLEILKKLDYYNHQVFMKDGDILRRLGRTDDAVASYHKGAALLEEANELNKALATYKIILRLAPGDGKAAARTKDIMERLTSPRDTLPLQGDTESLAPPQESVAPTHPEAPQPPPQAARPAKPANIREAFARHPIFSVLSDEEIKDMSAKANHLTFSDAQVVIAEDTSGDSIYVIKKGRASVTTTVMDRTMELASLGGLAFFGEGGFLTGSPRTATVTATGPLELMEIPKPLMSELIIGNPQVLGRLVEMLRTRASKSPKAS